MNTLEALQARRSIRGYLDKPVEEEKLRLILKYGNKAPNAGPFHMTVIRDKALLEEINQVTARIALASDNDFLKSRFSLPGYRATYGAPALILLSAPEGGFSAINTACAATNMGVAATELGLGSCFLVSVLMAFQAETELLSRLNLSAGYVPQCALILGYESQEQIPGNEWKEDYSNISYVD